MSKYSTDNNKKLIKNLLIIILILSVIFSVKVYKNNKNNENNKQEEVSKVLDSIIINQAEITEEKTERMLKVEVLQKENPDIVGWLEIEDTTINYPVLQGEDNNYYLKHTYKKEYSKNGSIFLDKDYNFSIPSSNLLIYGHNNKNGMMFEELIQYKDEKFYKEHSIIRFTTEKEDIEYEIIAVFKSRVYYQNETDVFRYYYFINAKNEEEYNYYIEESKKASLYDTGKTAKYGEQLLTLSTCDYSTKNGRFVVVAKKSKTKAFGDPI